MPINDKKSVTTSAFANKITNCRRENSNLQDQVINGLCDFDGESFLVPTCSKGCVTLSMEASHSKSSLCQVFWP